MMDVSLLEIAVAKAVIPSRLCRTLFLYTIFKCCPGQGEFYRTKAKGTFRNGQHVVSKMRKSGRCEWSLKHNLLNFILY